MAVMNEARVTYDEADGEEVETGPERTDGGYGQSSRLLDRLPTRSIRATVFETRPWSVDDAAFEEQIESEVGAGEDVPAIVTWHELLAQGR